MAEKSTSQNTNLLEVGVKAAGESIIPGASNLIEGNIKEGARHLVLGVAAKAIFGVPGLVAVTMNSLVRSVSGHHIHEHLGLGGGTASATSESHTESSEAGVETRPRTRTSTAGK